MVQSLHKGLTGSGTVQTVTQYFFAAQLSGENGFGSV
jgi:hypothetical protein